LFSQEASFLGQLLKAAQGVSWSRPTARVSWRKLDSGQASNCWGLVAGGIPDKW